MTSRFDHFIKFFVCKYFFIAAAIFCIVSFLVPVSTYPWPSFYHEYSIYLSLFFLLAGSCLMFRHWSLNSITLYIFAFSLVPILQAVFGLVYFWGDALLVFFYMFAAFLSVLCGQAFTKNNSRDVAMHYFALSFFVLGFVNVLFALNQYFSLTFFDGFLAKNFQGKAFGNLRQPNNFASALVISFFCVWYFFEKQFFSKKIYWLLILFFSIGLVLSQSRTTVLVGVVVFIFYCLKCRSIRFRVTWFEWGWVLLSYLLCFLLLPEIKGLVSFGTETDTALREFQADGNGRRAIWFQSLALILNGPLWGHGFNQIGSHLLLSDHSDSIIYFRHSHNLFLDILLYCGPIVGSFVVVSILWFAWQVILRSKTIEGWCAAAIVCSVFIHSLLEYPLHYAFFLLPVAFLVGLFDWAPPTSERGYRSFLLAPLLVLFSVLLVVVWNDYKIIKKEEWKYRIELTGVMKRDVQNESVNDMLVLTQRREHLNFGRAKATEGMSDEDIEWMKRVSHRFASPYYLSKYARACQLNGRYDEANRVLKVIKRLFIEDMYLSSKRFIYEGVDDGD